MTAPDRFQRAVQLLQPRMGAERRRTWLTQAYFFAHRDLYDAIDQHGAPADFTPRCVSILLDAGCRGGRHALSWLLEAVREACGEELQGDFQALIAELDAGCRPSAPERPPAEAPACAPASAQGRPSVFVSCACADAALVTRLVQDLEAAGHGCWVDTSDIAGGAVWLQAIAEGIEHAEVLVTLVTPAANQSDYVRLEYLHAKSQGKRVIPVLGERCSLPWYLSDRQAIPLHDDYAEGFQRLLAALPKGDIDSVEAHGEAPPEIDQRTQELAYLRRLELEDLQHTELYTPLAGTARTAEPRPLGARLPTVVLRPEFDHLPPRLEPRAEQDTTPRRFDDIVNACREVPRAVLLGEPGAGKTTALYKLASTALQKALEDPSAPVPLLVKLGEWTKPDQPLSSFMAAQLGPLGDRLPTLLDQKRAVLLLDGLNETPTAERAQKTEALKGFVENHHDLSAIITCRTLDYAGPLVLPLDTLTIRPLDPVRILDFVTAYLTAALPPTETDPIRRATSGRQQGEVLFWKLAGGEDLRPTWQAWETAGLDLNAFFSARDQPDAVKGKTTWIQEWRRQEAVHDPHSLMRLAENPYLLFMLTQVHLTLGELPTNRAALFGYFVEVLLLRERLARQDPDSRSIHIESAGEELLAALGRLAWRLQTTGRFLVGKAAGQGGEANVRTTLDRAAVSDLLDTHRLHQGASTSVLAVSEQEVRFTHQLLQEYFTARELKERWKGGRLEASRLWPEDHWWERTGWEESVILLAGLYSADCTAVVDWVAEANPEVAALCVERSGAQVPDETLERLRAAWLPRLTDLQSDPLPEARAAVGRALGRLKLNGQSLDNRPGVALRYEGRRARWVPHIEWVEIPAGPFRYQEGEKLSLPAFAIARYPITNAQFQAFVDDPKGFANDQWWEGLAKRSEQPLEPAWDDANHPRERVSWYEAVAFCRWLSRLLHSEVRLPTEREWEKAARGTDGRQYPWGKKYLTGYANIDERWSDVGERNIGRTTAVGIYPQGASPYRVMDLAGNVFEWCLNKYADPKDTDLGGDDMRVRRGGSWINSQDRARASFRDYDRPYFRLGYVGFRVVCLPPIFPDH